MYISGESQGKRKWYRYQYPATWEPGEKELPRSMNACGGLYASAKCSGLVCVNQRHKIVFCVTDDGLVARPFGDDGGYELKIEGGDLKRDSPYVMLDSELDLLVLTTSTDIIFFEIERDTEYSPQTLRLTHKHQFSLPKEIKTQLSVAVVPFFFKKPVSLLVNLDVEGKKMPYLYNFNLPKGYRNITCDTWQTFLKSRIDKLFE
jgi:hypothetical protein